MNPRLFAEEICRTLKAAGHQAYLVGGCVRDVLLGREPADYDVGTDATPEQVQQLFPRSLAVGAQFGVIVVTSDSPNGESGKRDTAQRESAENNSTESGATQVEVA